MMRHETSAGARPQMMRNGEAWLHGSLELDRGHHRALPAWHVRTVYVSSNVRRSRELPVVLYEWRLYRTRRTPYCVLLDLVLDLDIDLVVPYMCY